MSNNLIRTLIPLWNTIYSTDPADVKDPNYLFIVFSKAAELKDFKCSFAMFLKNFFLNLSLRFFFFIFLISDALKFSLGNKHDCF